MPAYDPSRRSTLALLGAGLAAGILASPPRALAAGGPGLFGSREIKRDNPARFPKWQGALDRYFSERAMTGQSCNGTQFGPCQLAEWQAFLDTLAGQPAEAQIAAVHAELNGRSYVLDPINWNLPDYWASPGQFLQRNGDCEDYGIAKFMSLRALGFPQDSMRVVVLHDMNLDVPHAVMAIEHGGQRLILDNQVSRVVPDTTIRHYRPIYSVNETHWWLHRA